MSESTSVARSAIAVPASVSVVSASDSIVRAMARAVGVGGIVFAGLALSDFIGQFPTIRPGWDIAFAAVYFLATLVLAVGSWSAPLSMLRPFAGVLAGVYLLGLASFVLAIPHQGVGDPTNAPWVVALMVIGTSAAAVSLPAIVAWIYLAVCGALITLDYLVYCGIQTSIQAVQGTLFQLFFCGIFVALAIASRRLSRLLDAAGLAAETETRRTAERSARVRERRRIDALMHDNVLSVLLASAVGGGEPLVADQARRALRQIERYGVEGVPEPVTAAQMVWELQAIVTEIAPRAEFRYELQGERPPPPDITAALAEAMAEALRNSIRHADPVGREGREGREAERAVHVHVDDGGVAILVLDDGVGFDPKSIAATRLGVSVSIVGRMLGLPGGYGAIESAIGRGTTVRIGWIAP